MALLERGARGLATGAASSGLVGAESFDLPRLAGLSFGASTDFSFGVTSAMPLVTASAAFCRRARATIQASAMQFGGNPQAPEGAPGGGGGGCASMANIVPLCGSSA